MATAAVDLKDPAEAVVISIPQEEQEKDDDLFEKRIAQLQKIKFRMKEVGFAALKASLIAGHDLETWVVQGGDSAMDLANTAGFQLVPLNLIKKCCQVLGSRIVRDIALYRLTLKLHRLPQDLQKTVADFVLNLPATDKAYRAVMNRNEPHHLGSVYEMVRFYSTFECPPHGHYIPCAAEEILKVCVNLILAHGVPGIVGM